MVSEFLKDIKSNNPTIEWDYDELLANPILSLKDIKTIYNMKHINTWRLSENPNLTLKLLERNLGFKWNWCLILGGLNLSSKNILKIIKEPKWGNLYEKLYELSLSHSNVNLHLLRHVEEMGLKYYIGGYTDDLPIEIIEKKYGDDNQKYCCYNTNITWDMFDGHENKINYNLISQNPSITWEIVKDNKREFTP